jgi:hypothetical protein
MPVYQVPPPPSDPRPSSPALACDVSALTEAERARHRQLSGKLIAALVRRVELSNGYAFVLDFSRLPADAQGRPFCVVEAAEWVDLESRCCPFLEFGIDLRPKERLTTLRLTGAAGVKWFLASEFPAEPADR